MFTNVGMDQQSLQWFRYMLPDRLTIDLENRNRKLLMEDNDGKKKPLKEEGVNKGIKRKKRRMKSKTKNGTSHNFEKFSTHTNKAVKRFFLISHNSVVKKEKHQNHLQKFNLFLVLLQQIQIHL